ncbi:MAG: HAMP domain-containing protein [Firmicutes bacterium]|jgi:signal transduction histidine kinase|nr:HAMP domain-containing protein [Bacillota bacterium]
MKSKITFKLAAVFMLLLLIFSLSVSLFYSNLLRNRLVETHKEELLEQAQKISQVLTDNILPSPSQHMGGGRMGMYGTYLRALNTLAGADIWLVDQELNIMTGLGGPQGKLNYKDLPADADQVVKEVFQGENSFSTKFPSMMEEPTLTVGVPLYSSNKILGALLLHSPIKGLEASIALGLRTFALSILFALGLALLLALFLAYNLTKPLKAMAKTALALAQGDYSSKTGVKSKDEIGELAANLDQLGEHLSSAEKSREKLESLRKDFLANISHELRTPITVIRGSAEALLDGVIEGKEGIEEYQGQIVAESIFLQSLVEDLLDLSKLQNPDLTISKEDIDLIQVLKDVKRSADTLAAPKEIEVSLKLEEQHRLIQGDYLRLRQMFLIILDNAIKFSSEKSKVVIETMGDRVIIADQGIGIRPEDLPYIFDRFYKADNDLKQPGSGLGLVIAKEIANKHGIGLEVESEFKEGTEFIFFLP